MKNLTYFIISLLLISALLTPVFSQKNDSVKKGVYEYVVRKSSLNLEEATTALEQAVETSGFKLAGEMPLEQMKKCDYHSVVLVLFDPAYALKLIEINPLTGPFAIADRINVFEDEEGVHVSMVNPANVNRTILMDDNKYSELTQNHRLALRSLIQAAVPGEASEKQYGKIRKKGFIGKTMGVMAGGSFDGKVKEIASLPGANFSETVQNLKEGMGKPTRKWGLHIIYAVTLETQKVAILGVSGQAMEVKSYSIVKAGSDKSRKKFACPGIAHAGAYPIEVVVAEENGAIKIRYVHTMYRMKMFFEDAGKWAFMKNMGMPGSLADEIKAQVKASLGMK